MRKVNIEEKTRALNEFRINSSKKTFTYKELREALGNILSKNNTIITAAIKLFPYEFIDKARIYEMPSAPIHKDIIKAMYKLQTKIQSNYKQHKVSSNDISEEEALALLSSKGYQIRKCVGFDLEHFAKENPEMYKKYMKYEIIQ